MKLIIYLASNDDAADGNYKMLLPARQGLVRDTFFSVLEYDKEDKQLIDSDRLFSNISVAEKNDVVVELVAHGSTTNSNEIRILPTDSVISVPISPRQLRDFFINYASERSELKFVNLTLFCCKSYEFGKSLSELMPEVNISCFKDDIKINIYGTAYVSPNMDVAAPVYKFLAGTELTPHVATENQDTPQSTSTNTSDEKKPDVEIDDETYQAFIDSLSDKSMLASSNTEAEKITRDESEASADINPNSNPTHGDEWQRFHARHPNLSTYPTSTSGSITEEQNSATNPTTSEIKKDKEDEEQTNTINSSPIGRRP